MKELFRKSRAFVSLSRAEGYGLTPLEALSQGCYVVTTPTPSTRNMSNPGLFLIGGVEFIAERAVAAVNEYLSIPEATALEEGGNKAYSGPFMETWAKSAARAFIDEQPSS